MGGAALLLNNPPPLDAGVEAAAPTLAAPTTTGRRPSRSAVVDVVHAPAPQHLRTPSRHHHRRPAVPTADASKDNPPELAALGRRQPCRAGGGRRRPPKVPSNLSPGLGAARDDLPQVYDDGCILDLGEATPKRCVYGDPNGSVTIVLFGDSHAAEWMPAMDQVARQNGWRLIVHTKKACPTAEIPTEKDPNRTDCVPWREAVIQQIAQLQPDLVVMSAYRYKQVGAAAGRDPDTVWREGIDLTVSKVRPLTRHLLLLGDSATPLDDVPSCLAGNLSNVSTCMNTRDGAVRPGRLAVERDVAAQYDADFIPTSDWMCTDTSCPVIVGNVLMYRDNSHITATASVLLAPYIDAALRTHCRDRADALSPSSRNALTTMAGRVGTVNHDRTACIRRLGPPPLHGRRVAPADGPPDAAARSARRSVSWWACGAAVHTRSRPHAAGPVGIAAGRRWFARRSTQRRSSPSGSLAARSHPRTIAACSPRSASNPAPDRLALRTPRP